MLYQNKKRNLLYIIFTVGIFLIIYSSISLVNHYLFRTFALDLGAYTNALYDYLHFQWNDSTVFKEVKENLLSDHFDLYLVLFSPLSLVFKSYTLLIVQILFLLLGGVGIYLYFIETKKSKLTALTAAIYFYCFFGIFSALSFDYHSNVVASAIVPWFFYYIVKKKKIPATISLIFILIAKENMALWTTFICIGLSIEHRKDLKIRNFLIGSSIFSAIYFVLITMLVMPAFSNTGKYPHFHYNFLGNNFYEAVKQLLTHPIESLKVLFINHNNQPNGDFVKAELHLSLLVAGLPLLLKKPQYLLMLIPIYFQKLFHNNYLMWGISGQYSVEYAPIMAIGIFSVIAEFKNVKIRKIIAIIVVLLGIAVTIKTTKSTKTYTNYTRIRFYESAHYQRDYDISKLHGEFSKIRKDAVVSVQSCFLPHLSLRDNIYQFPIIKDAEYIIISETENTYPLSKDDFKKLITKMQQSGKWKIIYNSKVKIFTINK